MKKRNFTAAVGLLLLVTLMLLAGCSGEKEEAGVVEQASDKVAGKAVEYINKPLDKAKASQAAQNAQTQRLEDAVQESGE
ncbi:MAG: hypothetical protein D3910_08820 [Candidatus Electrothrix sp. ATG2]|nr:hypothetical protein [Candidatus Electrothrix sp. ATG2]